MSQQNRTRPIGSLQFQHEVLVKIILTSFVIVNSLLGLVWDILDVNFAETSKPSKKYNQPTESTSECFCLFHPKSLVAKS